MKRFLLLFILITPSIIAQEDNSVELDLITDTSSAEAFLKTNKTKGNKLITFNEEKHKSVLATDLFKLSVGGKTSTKNDYEKTTYKVVEKSTITHYRMSYILLDSKNKDVAKTKAYRDRIITTYNNGSPFDFLAKKYSVADNARRGGDTGWFTKEETSTFFDVDITNNQHTLNELYTLDNDENNLYYIILNTYQPKEIKEIKVLKIVELLN
jgi:parvulin-like peptidyl-prolyl isomerase